MQNLIHTLYLAGDVSSLDYAPDGSLLATVDWSFTLTLWDTATWEIQRSFPVEVLPRSVRFAEDRLFVGTSYNQAVEIWDTNTWRRKATLRGHLQEVTVLAWDAHGGLLASGGRDGKLLIWSAVKRRLLRDLPTDEEFVNGVSFSPNGAFVAAALSSRVVVWDTTSWAVRRTFSRPGWSFTAIAWHPVQEELVFAGHEENGGEFAFYSGSLDAASDVQSQNNGFAGRVNAIVFSKDGSFFVACSTDATAARYHYPDLSRVTVYAGHRGTCNAAALDPRGLYMATSSIDKTVKIWAL